MMWLASVYLTYQRLRWVNGVKSKMAESSAYPKGFGMAVHFAHKICKDTMLQGSVRALFSQSGCTHASPDDGHSWEASTLTRVAWWGEVPKNEQQGLIYYIYTILIGDKCSLVALSAGEWLASPAIRCQHCGAGELRSADGRGSAICWWALLAGPLEWE